METTREKVTYIIEEMNAIKSRIKNIIFNKKYLDQIVYDIEILKSSIQELKDPCPTRKEVLEVEHPELVDDKWVGGCKGCPGDYWPQEPKVTNCMAVRTCKECWSLKKTMTYKEEIEWEYKTRLELNFTSGNNGQICPGNFFKEAPHLSFYGGECEGKDFKKCWKCWETKYNEKGRWKDDE